MVFLEMFTLSVGIVIMIYISATEAAALARTTAIFTFLLSILFLQQPSTKSERVGFLILIFGFLYSVTFNRFTITIKNYVGLFNCYKEFSAG